MGNSDLDIRGNLGLANKTPNFSIELSKNPLVIYLDYIAV
jgi:hypothetical protein